MGHGSIHSVTVSVVHPTFYRKIVVFFSGIIQTLNFSRKFQDFQGSTVAFLVILPFFNEGLNLKPCKTQVTRQKLK